MERNPHSMRRAVAVAVAACEEELEDGTPTQTKSLLMVAAVVPA